MLVRVHGLKRTGEYYYRDVTLYQLMLAWGRYGRRVVKATRNNPLVIGDRAVWSEVIF